MQLSLHYIVTQRQAAAAHPRPEFKRWNHCICTASILVKKERKES